VSRKEPELCSQLVNDDTPDEHSNLRAVKSVMVGAGGACSSDSDDTCCTEPNVFIHKEGRWCVVVDIRRMRLNQSSIRISEPKQHEYRVRNQ
jgi:hypothetical protein